MKDGDMRDLDKEQVRKLGLDPDRIARHQAHIQTVVSGNADTTIPILGACTIENGGIIGWDHLGTWTAEVAARKGFERARDEGRFWLSRHAVAMVPAAGAASRYLAELQKYVARLHENAPLLREMVESWLMGRSFRALNPSERSGVVGALRASEPSSRILGLPKSIVQQETETVQKIWSELLFALEQALLDDEASGSVGGLTLPVVQRTPVPPFDEASMRTHWETQTEAEGEEAMADAEMALLEAEEDEGTAEETAVDWVERLFRSRDPEAAQEMSLSAIFDAYAACVALLHLHGASPKALVPTTNEGDTFLRLKLVEQVALQRCAGNVLVVPAGMQKRFEEEISQEGNALVQEFSNVFNLQGTPFAPEWMRSETPRGRWVVMEQGNDLCSIRFNMDGQPYVDSNGSYSLVSAGHGELIHLFPRIAQEFPEAECVHIRNVDNVIGAGEDDVHSLGMLGDSFRLLRDALEVIRFELASFLQKSGSSGAVGAWRSFEAFAALRFLGQLVDQSLVDSLLSSVYRDDGSFVGLTPEALYGLLGNVFHWPRIEVTQSRNAWQQVEELLARPLSVMGVVEKSEGDVGGGPVFVRLDGKRISKLCMEMPHASAKDSERFFGKEGLATHFNPVLVFFELRTHTRDFKGHRQPGRIVPVERLFDDKFWLFSKKEYQGRPVCYHETVLYELIGNATTSNLVFVEVPRSLFTPHKTIFDSLGRDRGAYGFDEVLGGSTEELL